MDIERFDEKSPGILVKIGPTEHAFVPAPLPPDWSLSGDLWRLVAEARGQLGLLEGIGRRQPNPDLFLHPLQQHEALRSSSLEGTFATPQELMLFELDGARQKSTDDKTNDSREVHNYATALREATTTEYPLSLSLVKRLHEVLLTGVRGQEKYPGKTREGQVHIGADRRFVPPPLEHLAACLDDLDKYMRAPDARFDPLVQTFLIHYQFETIHPFHDGNGRTGRLLMSVMLHRWCNLTKPWLYMSAYFDHYKDEYIDRLFNVSARGSWNEWIEFCLKGTIAQAKETIRRIDQLESMRDDFRKRLLEGGGAMRLSQVVEDLFSRPWLRITDLRDKHGVAYLTAQRDVERLVSLNILKEFEAEKVRTFFAPDIVNVIFGDPEYA